MQQKQISRAVVGDVHKLPTDGVAVAQGAAELLQYHVVSTGGGSHMVSLDELGSYLDGSISVPGFR